MTYDERVQAYEAKGMTRSDAQGIVDLEDMRAAKKGGTMSTHTPGPWKVKSKVEVFGTIPIRCDDSGKPPLAYVVDLSDIEEQQANAHLIAAAPALLEALKLCVDALEFIPCEFIPCRARFTAKEAIRLAEGRG